MARRNVHLLAQLSLTIWIPVASLFAGAPGAYAQRACEGPQNAGDQAFRQVEMAISVDPNAPSRQVIAVTKPGASTSYIYAWYTRNGGRTWTETRIDPPGDPAYSTAKPFSDPAVTHDDQGNVHVVHLLNPRCCDSSSPCQCPNDRAIIASKSTDGGATYVSRAVEGLRSDVTLDKPWIGADREPGSPGLGNVYVTWSWVGADTRSFISRSEDRGETWSAAVQFATSTFFSSLATGPGGEVYAIWFTWGSGNRRITFRNLGVEAKSFQSEVQIADVGDLFPIGDANAGEPFLRASPHRVVYSVPSIAVDLSGGPNRGRIWVAYSDYSGSDPETIDTFVRWSDNGGSSWSTPVNLGTDGAQFLPWISVDPDDGSVGLVHYSTQEDPTGEGVHLHYRALWDGDPSNPLHWTDRRLTDALSVAGSVSNGDDYREYIGLDEKHNAAHASWTTWQTGRAQMYYTRVPGPLTQTTASATSETSDRYGNALAVGDFDGDGYADLAIGVPYEDDKATDDGFVTVHYGTPEGLGPRRWERFGQGSVPTTSETGDRFGEALAAGDFDGDGYDDLAVGIPGEDDAAADEGAVAIFYGSAAGLLPADAALLDQGVLGLDRGPNDRFGATLAAGDFDGNGYDDLAVGVPTEDDNAVEDGIVVAIYGAPSGLSTAGYERLRTNQSGVTEANGDQFGSALATGDFNRDGRDDLAIGVPSRDDGATDSGNVFVYYGSSGGLLPADTDRLSQPDAGRPNENGDRFGAALAAGDFDGDGIDDLAVGVPDEFQNAAQDGTVHVYYGATSGLLPADTELLLQTRGGETMEANDRFGAALAAGDVDRDGFEDLAVALPGEDADATDEGTVILFYGSPAGLIPARYELFRQRQADAAAETGDGLASAMAIGDFNGDCRGDLALGIPFENVGSVADAGAVLVVAGRDLGVFSPPRARITGDVDCDGCVDYDDRELIRTGLGQRNRCGTDVDGNGPVNQQDLELQQPFCGEGACSSACVDGDCDGYGATASPDCPAGATADCADTNPLVRNRPSEVISLSALRSGIGAQLSWGPPADPGGDASLLAYDVLRSVVPSSFLSPNAVCVESDGVDTQAFDGPLPSAGAAFHYLVRAGNACGEGSLGNRSSGTTRAGRPCP